VVYYASKYFSTRKHSLSSLQIVAKEYALDSFHLLKTTKAANMLKKDKTDKDKTYSSTKVLV